LHRLLEHLAVHSCPFSAQARFANVEDVPSGAANANAHFLEKSMKAPQQRRLARKK